MDGSGPTEAPELSQLSKNKYSCLVDNTETAIEAAQLTAAKKRMTAFGNFAEKAFTDSAVALPSAS